jgi:drug/metabolite transporter (DMT)-like permease
MAIEVFLIVLGAAFVHATWNALVKADGDRLAVIKLMSKTQACLSICLIPFVSVPTVDCWPFLLASSVLNTGYMLMLNRAYRCGDLSLVYPFARGVAPFIVAVVSILVLGETLTRTNELAVLLIGVGIASLALSERPTEGTQLRALALAVGTGAFIAGYTIVDGLGARSAGSPHDYMVWLSLITSMSIVACANLVQRGQRQPIGRHTLQAGIAAGIMSYGSSWVVIWALTIAPLALVSALRETGVVFAVLIGVVFLKEQLSLSRLASIATTLAGTMVLRLGRWTW